MSDTLKVVKVIESCRTSAQNNNAYRLVQLYERKYPASKDIVEHLYELVDDNMWLICTGEYK